MATEHLSLEFTPLSPCSVKNHSSSSSSSPQIFFKLVYDVRHKIGNEKVSSSQRNKALPVVFSSTVESWNSDPNVPCTTLIHKFEQLGIDSHHHVDLLEMIMERIYSMVESGLPSVFQEHNVMSLEIKVINVKTYLSLERVKGEQGGKVCSICLEEIGANGASTDCSHVYHYDCITEWLDRGETCPLCRSMMPEGLNIYRRFILPINPACKHQASF